MKHLRFPKRGTKSPKEQLSNGKPFEWGFYRAIKKIYGIPPDT